MRRLALGLAVAALLPVLTACGERSEPTAAEVPLYPVTVQGGGDRLLELAAAPRRIAAVGAGAARLLEALGAGAQLAGPSTTLDSNGRIRLAQLLRFHPDLIVASPSTDSIDLRRARRAARAPVYLAPEDSIADVELAARELGLIVEEPIAARKIVDAIERRRQSVARRVAASRPVSVFVDTGFFTTVSTQSLIGDLVREANGHNVAGQSPEPGPFDLKTLKRRDPDVYLATSDSQTSLKKLRSNRRTRGLAAVRSGRFGTIPVELLEPGPKLGDGLLAVARLLHPDAFR